MNSFGRVKIILRDIQEGFDEILFSSRRDDQSRQEQSPRTFSVPLPEQIQRARPGFRKKVRQCLLVELRALAPRDFIVRRKQSLTNERSIHPMRERGPIVFRKPRNRVLDGVDV